MIIMVIVISLHTHQNYFLYYILLFFLLFLLFRLLHHVPPGMLITTFAPSQPRTPAHAITLYTDQEEGDEEA